VIDEGRIQPDKARLLLLMRRRRARGDPPRARARGRSPRSAGVGPQDRRRALRPARRPRSRRAVGLVHGAGQAAPVMVMDCVVVGVPAPSTFLARTATL
jgi:hypothetical protein